MRFGLMLTLLLGALPVLAENSVGRQYSGVQRIVAPDGSVLSESRVFVDGRRLRLEFVRGEGAQPGLPGVLVRQENGDVHLVNHERKDATRIEPSRPVHYLAPEFMMLALLVDESFDDRPVVREFVRRDQVANQACDVLKVSLGPELGALLFVDRVTRLPVRVELGLHPGGPRADWSNVVGGAQPPQLFVIPADFQIRKPPDAGR